MNRDSVFALAGLAKKAGRLVSGEYQTENAVKSGKAALVIVSGEASENTKKKFRDMCVYRSIPVYSYGDRQALGAALGYEDRVVAAVLDEGFAKTLEERLATAKAEKLSDESVKRRP